MSEEADVAAPRGRPRREVVLEATTMALYISLSLLAVLLALPVAATDERLHAAAVVLGTGIGLVLAHHLAFRMSSRLVDGGLLTPESVEVLTAQATGGLPVAVLAALPVLLLGQDPGLLVSELLLVLIVAAVGYRSARVTASRVRALGYVVGVLVLASAVIGVKLLVGH
ncbi:MAG: hypothetical protein GC157_11090 [Frankiales bacterium]|nr:hypothetical protein [Frankiales bacterium]